MLWKQTCEELPDNYQKVQQGLKLLQGLNEMTSYSIRMSKKAFDTLVTQGYPRKMYQQNQA